MEKVWRKVGVVFIGILINVVGRWLANCFNLPIWFDMTGTLLAAYFAGIWGGIAAGACNSVIAAFYDVTALLYSLPNIAVAIIISVFIKKGYMDRTLKAVISSFWLGTICTVISTPLNLWLNNGYTGNPWGDTLVDMLRWHDVSSLLSALAGEAVIEIIDKQVCVLTAFFVIRYVVKRQTKRKINPTTVISSLMVVVLVTTIWAPGIAVAKEDVLSEDFVETIYNNANGMVSSEANTICETDDGCIWIGSYAGLTRFDGNKFEFITEGGLVNVVGMMKDSKGRLWIGTNDAGIARYENGKYTYFTMEDGLTSNSVRCFAETKDGTVYVGTSDKICRFREDDTIEVLKSDISFVKAMVIYDEKLVVMDNAGGIYAIDENRTMPVEEKAKEYFFYCVAVTSEGLVIGTESGELFVFELSEDELIIQRQIPIFASEIAAVYEDSEGRLWIATGTGVGYLDEEMTFHEMSFEGFSSSYVGFHEDYQGNIWIASSSYGVMKLSQSAFVNLFEKNQIPRAVVNAVEYYDGVFFFGTDNGLIVFDGEKVTQRFYELRQMTEGCRVRAIYADSKENLWVCTYNGLFCRNEDGTIRCYTVRDGATSDRFRCITELADGTIVAGTADGVNFISGEKITGTLTAADGLANTQILSVAQAKDGTVWAGSDGSGIYLISNGKLIGGYGVEDGLSSDIVLRIVPHADGVFLVTSNAVCHADENGNIRRLYNFPYFNNYDVVIVGETVYITCSSGLYETTLSELCSDSQKNYKLYGAGEGLISGLTANSWNYVAEDGDVFLCGNQGVVVFDGSRAGRNAEMKFGIVSMECDGIVSETFADNVPLIPATTRNVSLYASVRNYAFRDVKVRFFVKELEESPKIYGWNEIEPVRIFKPELPEYHVCLQILDDSGENVLQETVYTVLKEREEWEKPIYKWYLFLVGIELFIFTVISIVGMVLFVLRKNELEFMQVELESKVNEQTGVLVKQQQMSKELFLQTVTALSGAVDAKDRYTSGHSKRVAEYARMLAARMGKDKEEQEEIYQAGLLHDVGKIRIPEEIINKTGKLTEEEFNTIKIHPVTGFHILRGISNSSMIAVGAKYHHERYDGKGYPNGLAGNQIPEVARILGVADSYDAMTSNRSYRKALPQDVVKEELIKGKGTQFDPYIADIMLQMMEEDTNYELQQNDSMQRSILVVDDELMNHKLIVHIMKDEPMYEIVSAEDGKEALELLAQKKFNLILLDVNMPGMDGLETLRHIREKYDTPVALMTSDRSFDMAMEFAALGYEDYITKPFLPLLMKEIVHNMTERTNIEG